MSINSRICYAFIWERKFISAEDVFGRTRDRGRSWSRADEMVMVFWNSRKKSGAGGRGGGTSRLEEGLRRLVQR